MSTTSQPRRSAIGAMCSSSSGSRSAEGRSPIDGSTREGRKSTTLRRRLLRTAGPVVMVWCRWGRARGGTVYRLSAPLGGSDHRRLLARKDGPDLALLREPPGGQLAEDRLPVLADLEAAPIRGHEHQV